MIDCLAGVSQHQRLSFHAFIDSWKFPISPIVLRVVLTGWRFHHVLGQAIMAMVKRNWGGGFGGFGGLFGSMFGQMNQMMEALGTVRAKRPFRRLGVGWIAYVASYLWRISWQFVVKWYDGDGSDHWNGATRLWNMGFPIFNGDFEDTSFVMQSVTFIQHCYIILPWRSPFVAVFSAFILQVRKWTRWWWTHISRVPNVQVGDLWKWYANHENLSIWQHPPFLDQSRALKNNWVHDKNKTAQTRIKVWCYLESLFNYYPLKKSRFNQWLLSFGIFWLGWPRHRSGPGMSAMSSMSMGGGGLGRLVDVVSMVQDVTTNRM